MRAHYFEWRRCPTCLHTFVFKAYGDWNMTVEGELGEWVLDYILHRAAHFGNSLFGELSKLRGGI